MRKVTTTDGKRVVVHPHATDGNIDYGHPDYRDKRAIQRKVEAYQDQIFKVIDDNDLWRYMGTPGKMSSEYRHIRKSDPEMPQLIKCVKTSIKGFLPRYGTADFNNEVPEEWREWPFPGPIMRGQGIENADWIIDQEMKAIWAFALENIHENPLNPDSKRFKEMSRLTDVERARATQDTKVKLSRGDPKNKIIIPAGCALRFTLFDDPELPREHPDLRLVKYDHTKSMHNPELRSGGSYADMHAYVGDGVVTEHSARTVMADAKG